MSRFRLPAPGARAESDLQVRIVVAWLCMLLLFGALMARLVWLQLFQHDHFTTRADNNRIWLLPLQPGRGQIVDRNGVVLARNYSAHSLELTMAKVPDLAGTLASLRELVPVSAREEQRFRKLLAESRTVEPVPLKVKLTDEEVARVAANSWRLPGVDVRARLYRDYPHGALTSHVLGYIGRINQDDQRRLEAAGKLANYKGSEHIGRTGLEAVYEQELHGVTGYEEVEKDSRGRVVRALRRVAPEDGRTLKLALDIRLQKKADELFGTRRGALVAIDPQTGGVLAFLSKPGYDPALFIDGIDSQSWNDLNTDWEKPLVNRALRGTYPPGSTFKPFMAMAALASGSIGMDERRPAPGYYTLPGSTHQFRDSKKAGNGMVNLQRAITVSSDTFFYKLAWEMGIDRIHPVIGQFGLGSRTGIDLDGEGAGVLPSRAWKAQRFARHKPEARRWIPADVVSIGIGQGYNAYTPLQMALATARMANDGRLVVPHLVSEIRDAGQERGRVVVPEPAGQLPFAQAHFDYIKAGMRDAMLSGTAARAGQGLQYGMAGKTGTAQVVQIRQGAKYDASALQEQHRDHSWFIAFAPLDKPRIAVAIIVENAGFGSVAAAPLARALFDYHLLGEEG